MRNPDATACAPEASSRCMSIAIDGVSSWVIGFTCLPRAELGFGVLGVRTFASVESCCQMGCIVAVVDLCVSFSEPSMTAPLRAE